MTFTGSHNRIWLSVSIYSGCHNKITKIGLLKQNKFIFHSSGAWEVQDQDVSTVWFQGELSS